ncbi:MAG: IS200/IS605 family transposase [Bacteroidales bacterium]|nr:IS200/IS605 family transposase [Bacteroidales bacterium]
MSKYENFSHAKTKIRYHIIFSTKYRKKCLNLIHDDVISIMKEAENKNKNFNIEMMELDKDHIHFLLQIKPTETISNVVHYLKQISTYYLWKTHHDYLTKYYWKGKHHLWTKGYFCSTIGEVSEQKIKQYIEKQG